MRGFGRLVTLVVAATTVVAGLVAASPSARAEPTDELFTDKIDGYADYDGAHSCSPTDKPGAVALKHLLLDAYPGTTAHISRSCGSGSSEHYEGRAVDWMVSAYSQPELAEDMLRWLLADDGYGHEHAMARRLGVMYVIWNHEVWRAYDADDGWQPYHGSNPHTDHVHISLSWDGAWEETTWFTGPDEGRRLDQGRYAVAWRGEKRLDVFRRGRSDMLQVKSWTGSWGGWEDLGTEKLTSGPAAVWARKTLWVLARGADGTLVHRRWTPSSGWEQWKDTGVPIRAAPGVTAKGRRIDVAVVTPSSTAAHAAWRPGRGWSRWQDIGGLVTAPPALVWRTDDQLDVFVRGGNARLYENVRVDRTWSGWVDQGGRLSSGPAATSGAVGRADVFIRTDHASIAHGVADATGWSDWLDLGGHHVSGPGASALPGGRLDVFARDRAANLRQNYYLPKSGWSGWGSR